MCRGACLSCCLSCCHCRCCCSCTGARRRTAQAAGAVCRPHHQGRWRIERLKHTADVRTCLLTHAARVFHAAALQWLDECIAWQKAASSQAEAAAKQQQPDQQQLAEGAAADQGGGQAAAHMFAPVVGGASEPERQRSAQAAAERPVAGDDAGMAAARVLPCLHLYAAEQAQQHAASGCSHACHRCCCCWSTNCCCLLIHVPGFALCGFGFGEPAAARPRLLAAAMQQLPADKPKLVAGLVRVHLRSGADHGCACLACLLIGMCLLAVCACFAVAASPRGTLATAWPLCAILTCVASPPCCCHSGCCWGLGISAGGAGGCGAGR